MNTANISTWFEIILDDPDARDPAPSPWDELGLRALALAEAEAHLVLVEQALIEFEASVEGPEATDAALRDDLAAIDERFDALRVPTWAVLEGLRLRSLLGRAIVEAPLAFERRRKLLRRYLGEARAARSRAFEAWVEITAAVPGRAA